MDVQGSADGGRNKPHAPDICLPQRTMDARGEHHIFTALREMAAARITLVVTHHLDNVRMADRTLALDRGRIREEGTFDQLAYGDGLFAEPYALSQDR
ncbi:hypothetical protein [Streptomyces sp900116325]|uniref:hypothetical protein n=1 Tax=Streptomyces sp. 900116325 TaxID=3154295 RepID=UPI003328D7B0